MGGSSEGLVPPDKLGDVELLDSCDAYQGFFQIRTLNLRHRLFEGGWSQAINRELFIRHDAVGVLLYDPHLDVVALVEQFRVGAYGHALLQKQRGQQQGLQKQERPDYQSNPWLLELVAGLIDKAEPPELVAERESQEEAGAIIEQLEPIGQYYSSPGGSSEYFYLFCGKTDLREVGGVHGLEEESEDILVHVMPVEDAWHKLQQGQLNNAHTIIAMQWLQLNRDKLRQQWGVTVESG